MPVTIQLIGLVRGYPTVLDGEYVVEYDPAPANMGPGDCVLRTTPDRSKAKRYADFEEAHREWTRVDTRDPVRRDGEPNRPLTAYSVLIEQVEE